MHQNLILTALLKRHPEAARRLTRMDFVHGHLFGRVGEPIDHAVFPATGMISVVVQLAEGEMVEAAMVGRIGVVGGSVAFGGMQHISTSFCQLPGTAYLLPAAELAALAREDDAMRSIIFAHEQFMQLQSQQTAACNARHAIIKRLGTWLLRAKDVTGNSEMFLTQEFLAQMLGVQRASVSVFAGRLQDMELISYRRGRLAILDEAGLAHEACECHARLAQFRKGSLSDGGAPFSEPA